MSKAHLRRLFGLVALVLGVGVLAAACGAAEAPTATPPKAPGAVATPTPAPVPTPTPPGVQPKYGGIFIQGLRGEPIPSDPMTSGNTTLMQADGPLFGSGNLVKNCRGDTYNFCPGLAAKWETNSDFTQWTFTIRDNVFWHDGTPYTAEDAKFWVDLSAKGAKTGDKSRAPSRFQSAFASLKSVEVLDPKRLRMIFVAPVPALLPGLVAPDNNVGHPKHLMQPQIDKGNVTVAPHEIGWVGTGPFKLLKYDQGAIFQVRRFDKYYEKDASGRQLPFLDGIDQPIIKDPLASDAAFRTGRIEATGRGVGPHLSPKRKAAIEVSPVGPKSWFAYIDYLSWDIALNPKGVWADERVRRAVSLWLDRDQAILTVEDGFGKPSTFWAPGAPWVNPDFATWPGWNPATKKQDRERAKQLLAEAGYPNGFNVTIQCWNIWVPICEYLDGQLTGLLGPGKTKQELVDPAVWQKAICDGSFDFQANSNVGIFPQASGPEISPSNACSDVKFQDPKIDEYLAKLNATASRDDWIRLGRELERYLVLDKVYYIPTHYIVAVLAFRDHVKGVAIPQQNVTPDTDHATVWLDK